MIGYLMEVHNADDLVRDDPFGGKGLFLPSDLSDPVQLLARVSAVFGPVPAVSFPGHGTWIDLTASGLGEDEVKTRWPGVS